MAILMVFEMTENYAIIAPLMLACVLAYSVARVLRPQSVYAHALPRSSHAFALLTAVDVLRTDPPVVREDQPVDAIEQVFLQQRWQHVYVVGADGVFRGAVSLHDFGPYMRMVVDSAGTLPGGLLRGDYPRVRVDMTLGRVLETFSGHPGERLPVLAMDGTLVGYVSKTDLMLLLAESAGELT
jgi:CIC family chloride channel protein